MPVVACTLQLSPSHAQTRRLQPADHAMLHDPEGGFRVGFGGPGRCDEAGG